MSSVSLTFNFATAALAAAFLASVEGATGKDAPTAGATPAASPPSAGKGKKDATTAAPATQSTKSDTPPASSAQGPAASAEMTEEQRKALYEKMKIGERIQKCATDATLKPKVIELLAKYGVKRGPELKADQYDAFSVELDALLAPPAGDDSLG